MTKKFTGSWGLWEGGLSLNRWREIGNLAWWHTSVIPALRKCRQEDQEFKAFLPT